jgi:cytochrome c-type biogenesis protein CcmH
MFWIVSLALLLAAGFFSLSPLLLSTRAWKLTAWVLVIMIPLTSYFLYQGVGTPMALNPAAIEPAPASSGDMNELTAQLRSRLSETPEDAEGWVLLARSYKNLQKYPESLEAIETANRLMPNQPLIQVELVETQLYVSGTPMLSEQMVETLEQAVQAEPALQKGLWLLGIAAAQRGNDEAAIDWWNRLLVQLDPASPIAQSVREQLDRSMLRLGQLPEPTTSGQWQGSEIRIELERSDGSAIFQIPAEAVLFVIIRPAGSAGGPPLGVKRVDQPEFPLQLALTDADSMLPQKPISSAGNLTIMARLSMTGQPLASAGDWQSPTVVLPQNAEDQLVLKLESGLD